MVASISKSRPPSCSIPLTKAITGYNMGAAHIFNVDTAIKTIREHKQGIMAKIAKLVRRKQIRGFSSDPDVHLFSDEEYDLDEFFMEEGITARFSAAPPAKHVSSNPAPLCLRSKAEPRQQGRPFSRLSSPCISPAESSRSSPWAIRIRDTAAASPALQASAETTSSLLRKKARNIAPAANRTAAPAFNRMAATSSPSKSRLEAGSVQASKNRQTKKTWSGSKTMPKKSSASSGAASQVPNLDDVQSDPGIQSDGECSDTLSDARAQATVRAKEKQQQQSSRSQNKRPVEL
ncbi:uncharacterized protein PITG_05319 [Phytophthora infestans T30-4]|uniref:Uncharacterized protein n=1 Tax=Phytophthora infestans (strain T30-4) TaxID=403677 RepID=D0N428_PHYIT|nr:uncharacterized protein PITG_05319 [Phytophthora infestans T30-4]EEY69132.1 hypothetical protein PITG_05319 [Phytophthora infestans T30-4]|eukprot:XP_002998986.1 hypothetical protein PITG_05319 [Phytophthora infestans T30-4]